MNVKFTIAVEDVLFPSAFKDGKKKKKYKKGKKLHGTTCIFSEDIQWCGRCITQMVDILLENRYKRYDTTKVEVERGRGDSI